MEAYGRLLLCRSTVALYVTIGLSRHVYSESLWGRGIEGRGTPPCPVHVVSGGRAVPEWFQQLLCGGYV